MKHKKIMLVAFVLLALIMMGAVSASASADNLTASESGDGDLAIVDSLTTDENLDLKNTVSAVDSEKLAGGEPKDLEINSSVVPSTVEAGSSLSFDFSLPDDFYGEVSFALNDTEVYRNEYSSWWVDIDLEHPKYGIYAWNLSLKDSNGNYNPLLLNGTMEVLAKTITADSFDIPSQILGKNDLRINNHGLDYDFYGEVSFKLNGTEVFYDDSFWAWDDIYFDAPGYGKYVWELTLNDDDYYPFTANGTMEILYIDYEVPKHVVLGLDDEIYVHFDHIPGKVTLFIDGEKFGVISLDDYWSSASFDLSGLSLENHTYELVYSGSGSFEGFSVNGSFDVDYAMECYEGDDYRVPYGESTTVPILIPRDASGKLTAVVNGKTFEVNFTETSDGYRGYYVDMELSNFDLGKNVIALSYSGNERYPAKSVNITVDAVSRIRYQDPMLCTRPYVSLILPATANGNLTVEIDDVVFAEVSGNNGVYNVSLESLGLGEFYIYASYDGDDFDVNAISDYINIIPAFTAPEIVGFYEGALITVEVPSELNGTFTIYKFNGDRWDEDEDDITQVNVTDVKDGKATLLLTTFDNEEEDEWGSNNKFILEFVSGEYSYRQRYYPQMRYFERNTTFDIQVPDVIKGKDLVCSVNDKIEREYDVYLDGVYIGKKYNHYEDYYDYDMWRYVIRISTDNLTYGTHKIEFRYVDEQCYYNSINRTYLFNVSYIDFEVPDVVVDSDSIHMVMEKNLAGNVTLFIDGKKQAIKDLSYVFTESDTYLDFDASTYGVHEWKLVYSGDATHEGLTKSGTFNFTYYFYVEDFIPVHYGQNYTLDVSLPHDATGNVIVVVNGKKFQAKVHEDIILDNFNAGNDKYTVTYEGDSKYPQRTLVKQYELYFDIKWNENVVSLNLPSDAAGNLVVYLDDELFRTVAMSNGTAAVDLSGLKLGKYYVEAKYDGKDYSVDELNFPYANYNITAPNCVWIKEGALIEINLSGEYTGKLIVEKGMLDENSAWWDPVFYYVEVNSTEIVNGKASIRLTAFDGPTRGYDEDYKNVYRIVVELNNTSDYVMEYNPVVFAMSPDAGFYIIPSEDVALKSDRRGFYVSHNLGSYYGYGSQYYENGYFDVYVDDEYVGRFHGGSFDLDVNDMDYGTHKVDVFFSGDEYYHAQNASAKFNVSYMRVGVSSGSIGDPNDWTGLWIEFEKNIGGFVTVYVDGKEAFVDFASSRVDAVLSDLTAGNHTYEVVYSGDANHSQLTQNGNFSVGYYGSFSDGPCYEDETYIYVYVIGNATGSVEITIDGERYTENVTGGVAEFCIANLTAGEHNVTARYLGDDRYPAYDIVDGQTITVNEGFVPLHIRIKDSNDYWIAIAPNENVTVYLNAPEYVKGYLVVELDDNEYESVELVDGKASVTISNLGYGCYDLHAYYSGDAENIRGIWGSIDVRPIFGDYNSTNIPGSEIIVPIDFTDGSNGTVEVYDDEGNLICTQNVVNGKVNINLTDKLDFGSNPIEIVYGTFSQSLEIEIVPAVEWSETIMVGEVANMTFTFPEDFNGFLKVRFSGSSYGDEINQPVVNGKATVQIPNLDVGRYYFSFYYKDNDHYMASYNYDYDIEIEVMASEAEFEVFNSTQNVKVKFDDNVTGAVLVKIDGDYYYAELEDSEAVFDTIGSDVTVSYTGDKTHKAFKNISANVTEEKADLISLDLIVKVSDIDVGKAATVSIETNKTLNGIVTLTVNKVDYPVTIANGKGSQTITDLPAGKYDATVRFAGDDVFGKAKNTTSFNVNKLASTITLNAPDRIGEGSNLTVSVAIPGATGDVIINGKKYSLANGAASATISNVEAGSLTVEVRYDGDAIYANSSKTKTVTVYAKKDVALNASDVKIKVGDVAQISISIDKDATGKLTVNGTDVTYSAGAAKYEVKDLASGNYTYVIRFAGDDNFKAAEKSVTVTVEKIASTVAVDVEDIEVGQTARINVTVNADATGDIVLVFEKQNYTQSIKNGRAAFEISDLEVGNYTFDAVYAGDSAYKASSMTKSIEVKKADVSSVEMPISVPENEGKFSFKLPASAKGTATLKINGKEYPAEIKDGEVVIDVSELPKGKYEYTVSYSGDENFEPFTKDGVFAVGDVVTSIAFTQVDGNCVVEGVLMDDDGRGIANMNLTAKVGESNVTVKTDAKGKFVIQAEDNSALTVAFAGKDGLLATNNTIVLKNIAPVRTATSIVAKDYETYSIDFKAGERGNYFKVKLVDAKGNPLANKLVKIGFNGVVYEKVTDNEGNAQLQINLKNAGVYTFAVAYLSDDDYTGSFVVQKITVKEKTTSIAAAAKTFKASAKTKSYTVTLKTIAGSSLDGKTYMEAGKKITLTVNGKTYSANTNGKGQATFKLSLTKKGTYTASISFAGDKAYKASKASAKIKIN